MEQAAEKRSASMTELAQARIAEVITPGDCAIDATIGNGFDTFFLAHAVGPTGRVIGFDIQPLAHDRTHLVLGEAGLLARVKLLLCGHERMLQEIPHEWLGRVKAVMFNLGYLPRGDKAIITQPDTTLPALNAGATCLCPGGRMTAVLYPGHAGGEAEANAVKQWAATLPADNYEADLTVPRKATVDAPELLMVSRHPA